VYRNRHRSLQFPGLGDILSVTVAFKDHSVIWSHYLRNVFPDLLADVDVLKDILMFRENKQ